MVNHRAGKLDCDPACRGAADRRARWGGGTVSYQPRIPFAALLCRGSLLTPARSASRFQAKITLEARKMQPLPEILGTEQVT